MYIVQSHNQLEATSDQFYRRVWWQVPIDVSKAADPVIFSFFFVDWAAAQQKVKTDAVQNSSYSLLSSRLQEQLSQHRLSTKKYMIRWTLRVWAQGCERRAWRPSSKHLPHTHMSQSSQVQLRSCTYRTVSFEPFIMLLPGFGALARRTWLPVLIGWGTEWSLLCLSYGCWPNGIMLF